ncbi:hypothetical protein QTP88_028184 [Uroleucon formosanum]
MVKWGFNGEAETCDCGERQADEHLLSCTISPAQCTKEDLTSWRSFNVYNDTDSASLCNTTCKYYSIFYVKELYVLPYPHPAINRKKIRINKVTNCDTTVTVDPTTELEISLAELPTTNNRRHVCVVVRSSQVDIPKKRKQLL